MYSIYLFQIIVFISIPLLINANPLSINDDPNSDYVFNDELTNDVFNSSLVANISVGSTTLKTTEGIEIEETFQTSTVGQTNNSTSDQTSNLIETNKTDNQNSLSSSCSLDAEELRAKVTEIISKHMPSLLKLKDISRGSNTRLILEKGRLSVNNDFKPMGQTICEQIDEQNKKYDFMVAFEDLAGYYDWKIYNFFGSNFSESAIISIKRLHTEFAFTEDSRGKTLFNDVKVGTIQGLNVKVNIPEDITRNRLIKQMMQYVISRITTMVVNRSKDSITKNMGSILIDAIKEKAMIRP